MMDALPVQAAALVLATFLVLSGAAVLLRSAIGRLRAVCVDLPRSVAVKRPARESIASPPLPERLSRDVQWDRASVVINQSIARTAAVRELQRSAEQQLDSATYAIQRLFDELSGVMTIHPVTPVMNLAPVPVVRPFPPAPAHAAAGEAIAA